MTATFDVRSAVRAVIRETDLTSPDEIAAKVAESVPAGELRAVLAIALRDLVRIEFGRSRMESGASPIHLPTPPARSAKVRAIREAAPKWLRDRVCIGGSTHIMVRDCTYENLRYIEAQALIRVDRERATARRWGTLAELVQRHGVERVADLPAALIAGVEQRVAA